MGILSCSLEKVCRTVAVSLPWLIFLLLSVGQPARGSNLCDAVTQIPLAECEALERIYIVTRGPNWSYNDGWLSTPDPCSWVGVTCQSGHVVTLSLSFNFLTGAIPAEIGNLSELESLNLLQNKISSLPPEIGKLHSLRNLNLSGNRLRAIPAEIGNLRNLESLTLSDNAITSLPDELGKLQSLRSLHLLNYTLYDIPAAIGDLQNLRELRVSAWSLGHILSALPHMTELEILDLSNSELTQLPTDIRHLTKLRKLDLSHNQLISIPPEIGELSNLQGLNLANNRLTELPEELYTLLELRVLDLSGNELTSLSSELGGLVRLEMLNLVGNKLIELPPGVERLTDAYQGIFLAYNRLETVPGVVKSSPYLRGDWQQTQTIAPTSIQIERLSADLVELSWEPIPYLDNSGHYEISSSNSADGPYSVLGRTKSKTDTFYRLEITQGGHYYFVVRTYTSAHDRQRNFLWSDYSEPVSMAITEIKTSQSDIAIGGYLSIAVTGLPLETTVIVHVNGQPLDQLITNSKGELALALETSQADAGWYTISISSSTEPESIAAQAEVRLDIGGDAPELDEAIPVISIPSGLSNAESRKDDWLGPNAAILLPLIIGP